jgi:signal transduction histidine kinase
VRRRLLVSYLVVTGLVLVAVLVPSAITYRRRQYADARSALQRQAFALAGLAEDRLEDEATSVEYEPLRRASAHAAREPGAAVVIADRRGRVVARSGTAGDDQTEALHRAVAGEVTSVTKEGRFAVAVPVGSGGRVFGAVEISTPTDAVDSRVRQYWLELGAVGAAALVAVVAIGLGLARTVSRPLEKLRSVATRLGEGDLHARAATDQGPAELRDLAADLNRTAERLERLVNTQAEFVGDVSHQLRTPLTAVRLRLENLESAGDHPEEAEAALAEVERASRLIDGLLALAKADAGGIPPRANPIDLRALAEDRVLGWSPLADELGVHITLAPGPELSIAADRERVGQVLDNLIANALDAAPANGHVEVAIRAGRRQTELHVIDDGRGMPDEDRVRAFDRFWRGTDGSQGPELGGSGLGLAIVARLAATDNGTARLDRAPTGGIDAVVVWPDRPSA